MTKMEDIRRELYHKAAIRLNLIYTSLNHAITYEANIRILQFAIITVTNILNLFSLSFYQFKFFSY